ncbi:hotdog domain-containing protein [Lutibacter aestuarii]|uniref:Hotdog domain-containing protein n=1 Tax=Lutibacter aestuarii TaxID=861111 RepID=A0ABW2Z1H1_9FLAO|nr:hotdog domain-containing protein [uncultured Lutibacter sp.]
MNEIKQNTHLETSEKFVGAVVALENEKATVELTIIKEMIVDNFGLAHGSFIFGLADYAAMLSINEPTVVLGKAEIKFLKPVKLGDKLKAEAAIINRVNEKKILVKSVVYSRSTLVFEGEFVCFVLEKHVLDY